MRRIRQGLSLLLCLLCLCGLSLPAFAQESSGETKIFDEAELQRIVDGIIEEKQLNPERVSIGYCYTATGDTWFYNEDKWYYSASMYKVPLMMLLAEEEAAGKIDRDTPIKNLPLGEAEELILTYSHNDYAHLMMSYFGTEPDCRDLYKQYSDLPDDYYISDFRDYSYFTAHFMTDVMKTLYFENERFPNIVESLLPAQQGHYLKSGISDYEVAQKYGALKEFNHTAGIVYTPNPFILVVMTEYCAIPEAVIGEFGKQMTDYTLALDEKLTAYQKQQEELAAAEEAKRLEEERLAAEKEAQEKAEAEARAKAEEERLAAEKAEAEAKAERAALLKTVGLAGGVLALLLLVLLAVLKVQKKKRRQPKNSYTPKH